MISQSHVVSFQLHGFQSHGTGFQLHGMTFQSNGMTFQSHGIRLELASVYTIHYVIRNCNLVSENSQNDQWFQTAIPQTL